MEIQQGYIAFSISIFVFWGTEVALWSCGIMVLPAGTCVWPIEPGNNTNFSTMIAATDSLMYSVIAMN